MTRRALRSPIARFAAGALISAVFFVLTLARVDLELFGQALGGVSLALVGLMVGLSAIEVAVRAARWRILLMPIADTGFALAYAHLSIGHLANAVLPARLGDVARAMLTGSRMRVSRTSVLGTVVVERIADTGILGLAALAGALAGFRSFDGSLIAVGVAGLIATAVAVLLIALLRWRTVAASRIGSLLLYHGRRFAAGGASLRNPTHLALIGLLTLASFVLAVAILLVGALSVGIALPLWQAAVIMAFLTLSTAIPAGPASIGTYEFVGVGVLVAMGHPAEASLLIVGIVHVVAVLTPASIGLVSMWVLGLDPRASRFGTRAIAS